MKLSAIAPGCGGLGLAGVRLARVLVLTALLGVETDAAPGGGGEPRVWTRADGVQVTGVFVALHGTVLALKEKGGRNIFWSLEQVSAGDRAYLTRKHGVSVAILTETQDAQEARRQTVAARTAKVKGRALLHKTEPISTGAAPAPQQKEPPHEEAPHAN